MLLIQVKYSQKSVHLGNTFGHNIQYDMVKDLKITFGAVNSLSANLGFVILIQNIYTNKHHTNYLWCICKM